jgi:hypothetical protein
VPTRQKAKVKKLVTRHLERLGSALE